MTAIYRRGRGQVAYLVGAVFAVTSAPFYLSGHSDLGFAFTLVGLPFVLGGVIAHDRGHREAGEPAHAMWGPDDRNRPRWLPKP